MTVEEAMVLSNAQLAKLAGLDPEICLRAANTILEHHAKESERGRQSLFEETKRITLDVVFQGLPDMNYKRASPYSLLLPHTLYGEDAEVCLLVDGGPKDNMKKAYKEALVPALVQKIITENSLKRKYSDRETRKSLQKKFDVFLAGDSLKTRLPKLLGRPFVNSTKYPAVIDLSKKRKKLWADAIRRQRTSTTWFLRQKSKASIRVGLTTFNAHQLAENCIAAVQGLVLRLPNGLDEILKISLRGPRMPSLPVYQSLPSPPDSDVTPSQPDAEELPKHGGKPHLGVTCKAKKKKSFSTDPKVASIISSILEESIWRIGALEDDRPSRRSSRKIGKRDFTRFSNSSGDCSIRNEKRTKH